MSLILESIVTVLCICTSSRKGRQYARAAVRVEVISYWYKLF